MTPTRFEQIRKVFVAAQRLPAAERSGFVRQQSGADAELAREVEQLLDEAQAGSSFLDSPIDGETLAVGLLAAVRESTPSNPLNDALVEPDSSGGVSGLQTTDDYSTVPSEAAARAGTQIGPYRILRTIGEGGMGTVYEAEQRSPIVRKVALKVVKWGMDTREVIARFESERQALALMDHANIARVLDAGATETGRPYFVMELVKGEPITKYCDVVEMPLPDRLELFVQVCHAVQHAHTKGIIHRDIKPSNVLVALADGKPTPKVIDFGIAKATSGKLTDKTVVTEFRQVLGTPAYMSPEQAELTALDIDTRSDVYSLGVLLYELLSGQLPFDPTRMRSASLAELQRIIREEEPPTPSSRISTLGDASTEIASRRRIDPQRLRRTLKGDLDWIVMKCLEKDRGRRYETANSLATETGRYLSGELVVAAPPSFTYRLSKFVRRNRGLVAGASLVACVLVLGAGGTTWGMLWALDERARAQTQTQFAQTEAEHARTAEAEQRRLAQAEAESQRDGELERQKAQTINEMVTKALVSSDPNQRGKQAFLVTTAMEQVIQQLDAGELKDQPNTEAALRLTVARILNGNARSEAALRIAQRGLAIRQELYPGDHRDVAASLSMVAHCLKSQGRWAEALRNNEAALEMHQRLVQGDDPTVAASLGNVANCLQLLGRWSEALPNLEAALEMYQRLFQGDHPEVAVGLNNVAVCLDSLGRSAEALPKSEAALEMYERLYQGDHPDVAHTLTNVAYILQTLDRPAEALPKFEAVLEMYQRLFQSDHPDVAAGLNNAANCLKSLDRLAEALSKFEAGQEMLQRLFQGDHPDVAAVLTNVAACLDSLGRSDEALPKYDEALEMYRRLFQGDHPDVANTLHNVGCCLQSLDRWADALPKFEAALEMYRRTLPTGHPQMLYPQIHLAKTLVKLSRFADAAPLLLDAAGQCERSKASRRLHWRSVINVSVQLYDAWHAAEPDRGYDAKAAEWRATLAEWQASTQPAAKQPGDAPCVRGRLSPDLACWFSEKEHVPANTREA